MTERTDTCIWQLSYTMQHTDSGHTLLHSQKDETREVSNHTNHGSLMTIVARVLQDHRRLVRGAWKLTHKNPSPTGD